MIRRSWPLFAAVLLAIPSAFSQIASISPTSAPAGSGPVTVTLHGQFPVNTTQPMVDWYIPALDQLHVLTLVGTPTATTIVATIPASLLTQPESAEIYLNNNSDNFENFTVTIPPPTLSSLSPNTAVAGSPGFTLTVNGANFPAPSNVVAYLQVTWNGTALPTAYVNSGQLTATVPASLLASVGTASVTLSSTPAPAPLTFTITAPPLVLSSILPTSVTAGSAGFALTVNGSGFTTGTSVTWNGLPLSTSFVSATLLTASVPANLIVTAGTASVGVAASGQTSPAPISFAIIPTLTSLSPSSAAAGGPAFTLTVNGTGFSSGAVLNWGSQPLSTSVVNPNQLSVTVPESFITQVGTVPVMVTSGGKGSNSLTFNITAALPTLTSISPSTAVAGGPAFTITANGSGFTNGSIVTWNGSSLTTTFVSSTQLTATVPANLIATVGTASVGVSVPGLASPTPLPFVITPGVTLTSLSPASTAAGGPAFTLSVNGSGFASGANIFWNGLALATTVVNANLATASVPANLIAQQGTASITAQSGGVVSNALSFSITAPQTPVTLTSLSPSAAIAGSPAFTLTVSGSGFMAGTVVTWNGTPLATTFVTATQLTAAVPATLVASFGTAAVSVTGSPTPVSLPFSVNAPLTLTSISPVTAVAGGPAFTLTANGSAFLGTTAVTWNGAPLATTFISATQLTAAVPATLIASAGTATVDVTAGANQIAPAALQFAITSNLSLTSLSPASATAGGPAFTLTAAGTGFTSASTVLWNGTPLATTFVNSTQLTAAVSAALIAQPGSASVTVSAGTLVSNALSFTIAALTPVIRTISPSSVIAGSAALTLTVNGTGFLSGAVVSLNGAPLTTTFVSGTQVTAAVSAALVAQPGTAQVTLANPSGPVSNSATLTIAPPVPVITSISPASLTSGGPAFTLTVNGTGFFAGATVSFNSTPLTTTFVSATQLTASVPASLIAQPGMAQITAANTGGAASNAVTLTITVPVPTLTIISPSTVTLGGPAFTLTVNGTGFFAGAVVSFNSTPLTTTFVSATQLTASVPASLIAQVGMAQITAANTGGAASNAVTLTITVPVPTLTIISPSTVTLGGPAFTLTVNGTNFVSGATVMLGTTSLTTTFVSSTQLTAAVPVSVIQQAGMLPVTVVNPGSAPSNPLPLTVTVPVPTITSISPSSVTAGGPAFNLTINGSGFYQGVVVLVSGFNGSFVPQIVSTKQITVMIPAVVISQQPVFDSLQITVAYPGITQSNAVTLTVNPPAPTLTSLSPASANVGDPAFTLSVIGTGFVQGSTALWNGAPLPTSFISSTQLTAMVAGGLLTQPSTASVTVVSQVLNGPALVSNPLPFTINPVTPVITSLSPNSATAGGPAFTLTLNGTGFLALTTVQWNTTSLTTHFVSATSITADVPATLLAQAGTINVTAINPGSASAPIAFTINPPPPPVITSLSQTSVTAGGAAFTLTVTGTGFTSNAVVDLGSSALPTTFVSATQLTAAVAANLLLAPAATQVAVQQAGTSSNAVTFTIALPPPPALSLTPPTTTGPAQQPTVGFGLTAGYPLALAGTVTLTFASNATVPVDDPSIQFASGGRTMSFNVAPNTTALPALMIQTGTVAGVITLKVDLTAAGVDVTPAAGSTATITVAKAAPVIRTVTLKEVAGYLEVDVSGFSTTRDMTTAVFQLNAAPGGSFITSSFSVPLTSIFTTWYQSAASATFGSQFTYAQPFTVIGNLSEIQSVTVTLTNSAGTSVPVTAQ